jgi:hypothetical protein
LSTASGVWLRQMTEATRPTMDPLTIALLIIVGCILLSGGSRVLVAVVLIPTALFIGLLALLLVIGCGVLAVWDERRAVPAGRR